MRKDFTAQQIFNMILEGAKRGKNAKDNTSANKKAVKDITDETEKIKGCKKESKPVFGKRQNDDEINDWNSSTLGFRFTEEPSQHWKDRVKSLALGYSGIENQKNASKEDFKKEGDFEGDKKFYDKEKKKVKKIENDRQEMKSSGLKARQYPKDTFKSKTSFNEMKLVFNKTFLDENEVLENVPSEYQVPGMRFIMEDASKNKYLVECSNAMYEGFTNLRVVKKKCSEQTLNEAMDRAQALMNYNSNKFQYGVSNYKEKQKCDDVQFMLGQMRGLEPQVDSDSIYKV